MHTITLNRPDNLFFDSITNWDELAGGVPFRQSDWSRAWWEHFGRDRDTILLTVRDDRQDVRGLMPLVRRSRRCYETIGGGKVCSDHVSLLAAKDDIDSVAASVANYLIPGKTSTAPAPGGLDWDRIRLEGVVAGDPGMRSLLTQLQNRQAAIRIRSRMNVWYLRCHEDWESFLASCDPKGRNRYRSTLRKLLDSENPLSVRFVDQEVDVEPTIRELIRLHQEHWTANGQPGSFADPAMTRLILEMAGRSFQNGRLLLPTLVLNDPKTDAAKIIAGQINFIGDDGRLYCYSTAVDYEYAKLSPGTVLNTYLFFNAHEHRRPGIDLMRGDEEYKRRLGGQPSPSLEIDVFSPSLAGEIGTKIHDLTFATKQAIRGWRNRPLVQTLELTEAFAVGYQSLLPGERRTPSLTKVVDSFSGAINGFEMSDVELSYQGG